MNAPPVVVVAVVVALCAFAGAVCLLAYGRRLELRDTTRRQVALAGTHRAAQYRHPSRDLDGRARRDDSDRDFDTHVATAFRVSTGGIDWARYEQELKR